MQTADELELLPCSHHFLGLNLNDYSPRQVSRFDAQEIDGPQRRGDLWLLPAGLPLWILLSSVALPINFIFTGTFASIRASHLKRIESNVEF